MIRPSAGLHAHEGDRLPVKIYAGLPAAPGVGIGRIHVYQPLPVLLEEETQRGDTSPEEEWQRYLEARAKVDRELQRLSENASPLIADIFLVHREILFDATLSEIVRTYIDAGASAAAAIHQATTELIKTFQSLNDAYFASRSADIRDVGQRLLVHLGATPVAKQLTQLPPETLLVADDLTPFDTTHLDPAKIAGIALAHSAPTAHTAILARSLGLPMVCGLGNDVLEEKDGTLAIVDGGQGQLLVDPPPEMVANYRNAQERLHRSRAAAEEHAREPAVTRDGRTVPVLANVNHADEALQAVEAGADGVGLLRTEYLFQERIAPPTVQTQFEAYLAIAAQMPGRPLTIRLLDVGGDKPIPYVAQPVEANPFLGLRGIRFLLHHPELLRDQLTALVQLAQERIASELRILVPMVSLVRELREFLQIFQQIPGARECREEGLLRVGAMIEVPSAAMMAERMARLVDYLSLGTNDLAQYTLAADRSNSAVAGLVSALDPTVLRLIAMTCQAGYVTDTPVAICGEIASDPAATPLLLGLGIQELSAIPPAIPLIKQAVRHCDLTQCRQIAEQALRSAQIEDVLRLLALEDAGKG